MTTFTHDILSFSRNGEASHDWVVLFLRISQRESRVTFQGLLALMAGGGLEENAWVNRSTSGVAASNVGKTNQGSLERCRSARRDEGKWIPRVSGHSTLVPL